MPSYTARGRFLFLLEGRSLPLHHHSLCIFLRNYAKDRGENISTGNASSLLDLACDIRPPSTPIHSPSFVVGCFKRVFNRSPVDVTLHVYHVYSDINRRATVSCCLCEHACFRVTLVVVCFLLSNIHLQEIHSGVNMLRRKTWSHRSKTAKVIGGLKYKI